MAFAVVAAYVAVVLIVGWIAMRFGYPLISLAVIAAGAGYLIFAAIQTLVSCGAEPEIALTNDGREYLRHTCDGPAGMLSYIFGFIAAPLGAVLLSFLAVRAWGNLKSSKGEAA
ncbi:MAG: hypothetical protein AAFQ64_00600 [Pseudomonadota bacterium]